MRCASTWTRRPAPEHQCLSHMSQIRMAVCELGKLSVRWTSSHAPLPLKASTRERKLSCRSAASAAPAGANANAAARPEENMRTIRPPSGRRRITGGFEEGLAVQRLGRLGYDFVGSREGLAHRRPAKARHGPVADREIGAGLSRGAYVFATRPSPQGFRAL